MQIILTEAEYNELKSKAVADSTAKLIIDFFVKAFRRKLSNSVADGEILLSYDGATSVVKGINRAVDLALAETLTAVDAHTIKPS
jgi:hypothetical protein